MKISKKIEAEVKTLMNDYWASYLEGNLAHWANYLVENYRNIGGTEEEIWSSKQEILEYTHRVIDQMEGMMEIRNKTSEFISYEPYVMVHEYMEIYLKVEEDWSFYQKFRISTLLQKIQKEWKVIHQHGSYPDSKTQEGEAVGTDALKAENERLLKAVENRTAELEQKNRELEIEGALQRVRAQVASMEKSDDLLNIVVDMRHEFVNLGHEAGYFWHMRWLPEKYQKAMTSGDGTQIGTVMELPRRIHGEIQVLADWEKSDEPTVIFPMDVDATLDYVHKMEIWGDFERIDPNMPTEEDVSEMGGITYVMARTSLGEIGYSLPGVVKSIPQAEIDIFVRFARAFDLAHKRFEDLKKSEEQAREVLIELALEKVRSRTMAMQKSEELPEAANNLFLQVQELGIPAWSAGYCIWENEDKDSATAFMSSEGVLQKPFSLPTEGVGYNFYKPLQKGETFHIEELGGDEIVKHYAFMRTLPIFGEVIDGIIEAGFPLPTFQIFHIVYFEHGYVMFITYETVPDAHSIFKRFGKVFEQTYTRFLDLQKAEAQAREAQIEVALERVRARAMGMHSSDELAQAAELLHRELIELGISPWVTGYSLINEEKEVGEFWLTSPDDIHFQGFWTIPLYGEKHLKDRHDSWKRKEEIHKTELEGDENKKHALYISQYTPLHDEEFLEKLPDRIIMTSVHFSHGYLFLITEVDLQPEEDQLLIRFAKVFELTYRRFLDLQKAESQAREAKIEVALERVRAASMAMHKSADLKKVSESLHEQLETLGLTLDYGTVEISVINEDERIIEVHQIQDIGTYPNWRYDASPDELDEFRYYFDKWASIPVHERKNHAESVQYNFENVVEWTIAKRARTKEEVQLFKKVAEAIREKGWYGNSASFAHGILNVGGPRQFSEAELGILKRFGSTFEQTYTRFLDLQKAEAQTREAQIEAALERVRARALAMHSSDELVEVSLVLRKQMATIGEEQLETIAIHFIPDEMDQFSAWFAFRPPNAAAAEIKYGSVEFSKTDTHYAREFIRLYNTNDLDYLIEARGSHLEEWQEMLMEKVPAFKELWVGEIPDHQYWYFSDFSGGNLMLITLEETSSVALELLRRSAKVFDLAYRRYLDLQKAEAQAREAQIEAAMERIRGRALAMHSSEEIMDVMIELSRQIDSLGQLDLEASVVHLYVDGSSTYESIAAVRPPDEPENIVLANVVFPVDATDRIKYMMEMYYSDQNEYTIELTKEMAEEWQRVMVTHAPMLAERRVGFVENRRLSNASEFWNFADFSEGSLLLVTHSPASDDTKEVLRKAANVFDLAYRRYRDLQKAEARAWEAQIETALEKVRSRSLAMHKTDELGDVIMVVFEKLKELNISVDEGVALITFTEGSKDLSEWMFNPGFPSALKFELPYFDHPVLSNLWEAKNKGEDFLVKRYTPEENQSFLDHIFNYTDFKHTPEEVKTASLTAETYSTSIAFQKNTAIFINDYSGISLSENEIDILKRFSRVFEQAYTRFLDLQKAEAQAREAQIEMALEKVRSRTMVMQHSNELPEAANLLFKEILGLGIPAWSCGYNILSEDKTSAQCWMSSEDTIQEPFELTYQGEPSFEEMYSFFIGNDTFLCQELGGKDLERHYAFMRSLPKIGKLLEGLENSGISLPTFQINHLCKFQQGYLLFITYESIPDAHHIFIKFTKVFEQTYTRFLDLQKAEAQAREAQIEVAVERIRAQSMAMHHPDDLNKVNTEIYNQLQLLDIDGLSGVSIWLVDENDFVKIWDLSSPGNMGDPNSYSVAYDTTKYELLGEPVQILKDSKEDYFVFDYPLEKIQKVVKEWAEVDVNIANDFKEAIATGKLTHQWNPFARHSNGLLAIDLIQPPNEDTKTVVTKITGAFNLAYQRFQDLQEAEARAREAKIEADLEKVRSRSLAMGKPEELQEVVAVVAERLKELGVIYDAGGVILCTYFPDNKDVVHWIAVDDFSSSGRYLVPYFDNPIFSEAWDSKSRGDAYFSKKFSVAAKNSFFEYAFEHSDYRHMPEEYKQFVLQADQHHLSAAWSKNSAILIPSLTGVVPSESDAEILKRFAKVFEQAYIRFMDLQVKEEQAVKLLQEKQRLEITLNDLQNTQTQLIQAEKMASLGELTAGIAHEIQNPLNFVNNFSDVSVELIDEAMDELQYESLKDNKENGNPLPRAAEALAEELGMGAREQKDNTVIIKKGNLDEAKDILVDLKNNLEKIAHHGGRASGIVKGMLDHSRNSSGEKVPTDINALADEYLRLSYHGLRAQDKSFNCALETNFDPKLEKIKVIPQDIGRVFLNIYNNAFYACSARGARTGADRSVSTEGLGVGGANEDDASKANTQPTDASVSTGLTSKENPTREEYKPLITVSTQQLNNQAIITISDNGIGMSKETLEKVFQPFFTTKPTGSGTGLGMSISYDIITKGHGGEMKILSEKGKGTTFILEIPIV